MQTFFHKISLVFKDSNLRKRILFVLGALVVFRLFAAIPVPGVDPLQLEAFLSTNQFFGLFNVFSGGGLANLSIMMLGVGPYITGSIIMQLLTIVFPAIKEMYQEEGEVGRRKFMQYARILTVPLAFIQGFAFLLLLQRQGILPTLDMFDLIINVIVITAGSVLLMWIGELITEFGISNGVSLIIFAGIVSSLPTQAIQLWYSFDASQIPLYLAFLAVTLIVIFGVILITEAERPIPITYAKRVRGQRVYGGVSTYLPLRLNQAGVIPIIFALSLLLFPGMIVRFLAGINNATLQGIITMLNNFFINNAWTYALAYFVLVFGFTYFYTAVTFDPEQISKNLQRGGAFIPGVRPGQSTAIHINKILTRLTFVGATFLGFIAILPFIMRALTGIAALAIGGTALLIVISVVIELVKQVDAQTSIREY